MMAWALGIAAVAAMYSSFYRSARQRSAETVGSLPPAFRQAFGFSQIASPAGYLEATVFNFIVPLLLIPFAAAAGARTIAGDEEAGTLDLLPAHPVGRLRLVLHRFAALAAPVLLGLLAIAGPAQLGIAAGNVAAMVLLALSFATVALAIDAATGSRTAALGGASAIAVLRYFVNTLPRRSMRARGSRGGRPSLTTRTGIRFSTASRSATRRRCSQPRSRSSGTLAFSRRDVSV